MILSFIAGGCYTLLTLIIGGLIGYLIGNKQLESKIESVVKKIHPTTPLIETGPIKSMSKSEQRSQDSPELKRQKELLGL